MKAQEHKQASHPEIPCASADLIERIASNFGSPVFIAWKDVFDFNCRRFAEEFSIPGRKCFFTYSYKTNNLKAFCEIARQAGFGAEVVSASEFDMAIYIGVEGGNIIYNGPLKTEESIAKAVLAGAAIHPDCISELENIGKIAGSAAKKARIGLRLTPASGDAGGPIWDKFGFSAAEGELTEALLLIARTESLLLEGFHLHFGTNLTDPRIYAKIVETLSEGAAEARRICSFDSGYIDIGGGFSSHSGAIPLTSHPEEWNPLRIPEAADAVSRAMDAIDPERRFRAVCEPGRVLAESAMSLLARVVSVKKRGKRRHVLLDAGTNILPTAYYTKHPVSFPGKDHLPFDRVADFHGPLCTQFDVMASEIRSPDLRIGDPVVLHGAGAYAHAFSSQFTGPRPAVVLVSEDETIAVARKKEPDDVLWKYDTLC